MFQKYLFLRRHLVGKTIKDRLGYGLHITGVTLKARHLYFSVVYEEVFSYYSGDVDARRLFYEYLRNYYNIRNTQITIVEDGRRGFFNK